MEIAQLLKAILEETTTAGLTRLLESFQKAHPDAIRWTPLGRGNNRGTIEAAKDPGRSLIERVTNAIDAVIEREYAVHHGVPTCRSPREAAVAWMGIPPNGLQDLSPQQRRVVANNAVVTIHEGDSKHRRAVDIRDSGVGLVADEMPSTILSLNEDYKLQKFYLAGAYGQGGSSTFTVSSYTLIASRSHGTPRAGVAFTLVRYEDLPADLFKHGRYVYLMLGSHIPIADLPESLFPSGALIRHYGYDLSAYPSPLGPNSIYGLMQQTLFDPVFPVWLEDKVHNYRRVIKGSRSALNGAVDPGDEAGRGPELAHAMPLFHVLMADYGRLGVEYWVLAAATKDNKRPSAAFVDPNRPVILTVHGQSHGELPASIIKKDADLYFLGTRLIIHLDCNALTPQAKRNLFVANREEIRSGEVLKAIQDEIIRVLRTDDELARLNEEAKNQGIRQRDEQAEAQIRQEVARILRSFGPGLLLPVAGSGRREAGEAPARLARPRPVPRPTITIEIQDPPTFLEILAEGPIKFYPGQRRYVRVRTDAPARYHNPVNPEQSRFNLILPLFLHCAGSTALKDGRIRFIIEADPSSPVGQTGEIQLQLTRTGLQPLAATAECQVVEAPEPPSTGRQVPTPDFRILPVSGPEDEQWVTLQWPEEIEALASSAWFDQGRLEIRYSEVFPAFAQPYGRFLQREVTLAESFRAKYEIWVAVHSLLLHEEKQSKKETSSEESSDQAKEVAEQQERCRLAQLASMFAVREIALAQELAREEE